MRAALVFVALACLLLSTEGTLVDLTHPIDFDFVYWPGQDGLSLKTIYKGNTSDMAWLEYYWVGMPEHSGTHLDAPAFFVKDHWKVADLPLQKLIGPAVVLDVSAKAALNPDYQVQVEDIQYWERDHGDIPTGAIVLVNSGWSPRFPNKTLVFGSTEVEDISTFHFPTVHPNAMQWLVSNRQISFIGIDTPSLDVGPSTTYPSHQIAFRASVPVLESVANLQLLPASGATVVVAPLKLKPGAGAPARILAILPKANPSGAASVFSSPVRRVLSVLLSLIVVVILL